MESILPQIALILVMVVLNGYFAAAEIALISARRASLKKAADDGSRSAASALKLTEDPSRMLASTQIGITLVGMLASATAAVSLAAPLAGWLRSFDVPWMFGLAQVLAVLFTTLVISYVTLVFGELAPKRLGLQRAEAVARRVAGPISFMAAALSPIVRVLAASTDLVSRALGVTPGQGKPGVTEEEIKLLVTEQGTLLDEEKRMIHEIFELGDTVAREVMVPRVDAVLVEDTEQVASVIEVMRRTGYSRLPVFHEDRDRIIGIVLLKDLVESLLEEAQDEPVTRRMREALFVPETKPILSLLSDMRRTRTHLVVVVDEHGGTAGLVTIEDIVEEIIGEVADEFDADQRFVTQVSESHSIADGRLPIEDAIEMGWPVEESDEYETLAGWLLVRLGHIPVPGESVVVDGWTFRVQAMRRRRIARVGVIRSHERGDVHGATDSSR